MREKHETENMEREILDWQERQFRLREKYSFTPAGFPDPSAAAHAENDLKKARWEYQNRKKYQFLQNYQWEEEGFVGRRAYLEEMDRAVEKGNGVIVLYGIGGIGKTALARAYIRQTQKSEKPFDAVLFLSYNTSMEALICDDDQLSISNLCYSETKYGSKANYFREKMRVLKSLADSLRLLLVIDDCNVEKDRKLEEVFSLPCHILVTTRRNPEIWQREWGQKEEMKEEGEPVPLTAIQVKEFDSEEEWKEFIQLYQEAPFSCEEWKEFFRYRDQVHGHTLLMMFKIRGISVAEKAFPFAGGTEQFAEDLFRRFKLSKNDKQILCELSIMPVQGIEETLYYQLSKVSKKSVGKLANCLLLRRKSGWLSLHPIIAQAAKNVFRPGQKTYVTWVDRMQKLTFQAWNHTYLENQKLEPYVFAILREYPAPFPWQYREYDAMITLLWIQGYFEEAAHYQKILLETVKKHYGRNHQITGEMMLRMAAVYYNAIDFEKAHGWYVEAYECLESSEPYDDRYAYVRSSACAKLAREYQYRGRFQEALGLMEKAIAILGEYEDRGLENRENKEVTFCYMLLYKAKILWDMERYEEAWKVGNAAQKKVFASQDVIGQYEVSEFDRFLIKAMIKRGDYEEAELLAISLVERTEIFRNQISKENLSAREHLADVWEIIGKKQKAAEVYEQLLEILREEFPYQKQWVERIREKVENVKNHLIAEKNYFL